VKVLSAHELRKLNFMTNRHLPYSRQNIDQDDIDAVVEALKSRFLTTGPEISAFESELAEYVGAKYAVVCSSGTAGLHLAMMCTGIQVGQKVLTSPITFVADANVARYVGADVVLSDVSSSTVNICPKASRNVLLSDPSIKVLVPVHFAGQPYDVNGFSSLLQDFDVSVVEDACHALGAEYQDVDGKWRKVGSCHSSLMTVFSFHPVKTMTTGEGGCITTNDKAIYQELKKLRSHGVSNDPETFQSITRGFTEIDGDRVQNPWYYEMQSLGFNYRITDFQCALGRAQLKKIDQNITRRHELTVIYREALHRRLGDLVRPLHCGLGIKHAHHLFVVRIPFERLSGGRAGLMNSLLAKGIHTQVHYMPIQHHPYYQNLIKPIDDTPNANQYYGECLSLPLFAQMEESDVFWVVDTLDRLISASIKR